MWEGGLSSQFGSTTTALGRMNRLVARQRAKSMAVGRTPSGRRGDKAGPGGATRRLLGYSTLPMSERIQRHAGFDAVADESCALPRGDFRRWPETPSGGTLALGNCEEIRLERGVTCPVANTTPHPRVLESMLTTNSPNRRKVWRLRSGLGVEAQDAAYFVRRSQHWRRRRRTSANEDIRR